MSAFYFLKRQTQTRAIKDAKAELMIGHCRYATHGEASKNANNHPHFSRDGRLAIVHNGVIWSHDWLAHAEKLDPSVGECDSESIAHLLAARFEAGPKSVPGRKAGILDATEVLDSYMGDFAVAALDRVAKCLWLFRNESNPLHYVRIPGLGITLFASESGHLHEAVCSVMNKRMRRLFDYHKQNIHSLTAGQAAAIMPNGSMVFSRRVVDVQTVKYEGASTYGPTYGSYPHGYVPYHGKNASVESASTAITTTESKSHKNCYPARYLNKWERRMALRKWQASADPKNKEGRPYGYDEGIGCDG